MKGSYQINSPTKRSNFKRNARSISASIIVGMQMFAIGAVVGYPSTAIPNINSERNVPFHLNLYEQSWFGSITLLTSILGCILSAIIMDVYGRKLALLILAIPTVSGWVILVSAQNIAIALVGRAITGVSGGAVLPISFAYASEIVPPKIRGQLVSFMELALNGGILFSYIVGTYIPWNWFAIACAATNCLANCVLLFVPETPRWLLLKGHEEEARESMNWLRGSETESEKEISEILEGLKSASKPTPWITYFKRPLLKSTLITLLLFTINELSGLNCIRLYTVNIFRMSGSDLNANTETVIVGATAVLGSVLSATFADVFERRTVFIVSLLITGLGLTTIGTYVQAKDYFMIIEEIPWLPLVGLLVATLGYAFGGTGMTSIITCEMFSTQARGRAISIGYVMNFLSGFAVTNLFLMASKALGEATVFYFFAGVCLFGIVIVFFIIPKTKGLSMEEIQKKNSDITAIG